MKINSKPFLFWCGIVLLNLIVFMPAFALGPRGDTLVHLAATSSFHSLVDYLSFYLSQEINEPLLFRPLLHGLLAFEIWFFHFNFFYWQLTSFLLHMLAIWQILKILPKICASSFWYAWVALFSVLTISAEMVAWPQISGYLIFVLCFLQTLNALIDTLKGNDQTLKMTFWILIGALFYEFSIVCTVVFFFTLQFAKKKLKIPVARPWLVLLPLVIILPLLFPSASQHHLPSQLNFTRWIDLCIQMFAGIAYAFLPTVLSFEPNVGRIYLNAFEFQKFDITFCANVIAILLLALCAVYWIKQNKKSILPQNRLLARICGLLFLLQAGFVAIRAAMHPFENYIQLSLYHYYFTLLLFLLWLSMSIRPNLSLSPKWFQRISTIAVSILIVANAICTQRIYHALAQKMTPWTNFITATNHFIQLHHKENNFSFQVIYTECSLPIPMKNPDGKRTHPPDFELLFKPYLSQHPTYYLVYFQKTGLRIFTAQNEALQFTTQTLSGNKKI